MENIIIKFVADTSGLEPAIKQLQLLGKITDEDAAKFNAINQEQKEFIQNVNKSATEFGKLSNEVGNLSAEIQGGVMNTLADGLKEVTGETVNSALGTNINFPSYNFLLFGGVLIFMMLYKREGLLPESRLKQILYEADDSTSNIGGH